MIPNFDTQTFRLRKSLGKLLSRGLSHFTNSAPDGDYFVTISVEKVKRTIAQNNYYWGAYVPLLVDASGMDKDSVHEFNKKAVLYEGTRVIEVTNPETGQVFNRTVDIFRNGGSTRNMTKTEFSDFIQGVEEVWGILAPPTVEYGL